MVGLMSLSMGYKTAKHLLNYNEMTLLSLTMMLNMLSITVTQTHMITKWQANSRPKITYKIGNFAMIFVFAKTED